MVLGIGSLVFGVYLILDPFRGSWSTYAPSRQILSMRASVRRDSNMEHNTTYLKKPPKKEEEDDNEVQVPNIMNDEVEGILGIEDAELWDFNGVKPESPRCGGYLNLSLNYEEVLEAWCNRGPLWAPPSNTAYMGEVPVMEEEQGICSSSSTRQVSVMRYREKRQSRLFSNSKKIRYQVRTLNADKRPRIKGRFVKRLGDKMQKGS